MENKCGALDRAEQRAVVEVVGNNRAGDNIARFARLYIQAAANLTDPLLRTHIYHGRTTKFLMIPHHYTKDSLLFMQMAILALIFTQLIA